jgi:hypothetical protein
MNDIRVARLYDGIDPVTGPYFDAGHARLTDPVERARLDGYLRRGRLVLLTTARDVDVLDPARRRTVAISVRTDGSWVWSDAVRHYLTRYGTAPDDAFYDHIRQCRYQCPGVDEPAARRALAALRGHPVTPPAQMRRPTHG